MYSSSMKFLQELAQMHTRTLLLVVQFWDELCKKKHPNEAVLEG
ncbi:hypothetical protein HanXRQr2_Chr09g0370051 [Helianthus annuus]|uniref:Uncharacterized protein n=1 Tax=Helianthus annuus TaxID=4232 RepID=A0A9K3N707_HELAN|nr:hypothetical protein HanXRQr2_Chr09g0370051 [Helianthus annuus]